MSRASLGDRIRAERARRFVGREAERGSFARMLDGTSPRAILLVSGPGGVGKTSLLSQLRDDAERAGRRTLALDGRDVEPTATAFLAAIAGALDRPTSAIVSALAAAPHAIFVDTYELLPSLDGWLRNDFVPGLPDGTILVLSGRELPAAWRLDPGLAGLVERATLTNLGPEQARELLTRRGVDETHVGPLAEATHGHPLALALLADLPETSRRADFRLEGALGTVQALLDCFVRAVPSPEHARALVVCAVASATTVDLLAASCDPTLAHELHEWLRSLSFVERGPRGLYPHDLARDVLTADAAARDPVGYRELRRRIRDHHMARRAAAGSAEEARRAVTDVLFLHRQSALMRLVVDFPRLGSATPTSMADEEIGAVLALSGRRAGPETQAIVAAWHARRPEAFQVYRDARREIEAFTIDFDLDRTELEEGARFDPVIATVRALVGARPEEGGAVNVARAYVHRTGGIEGAPCMNDLQARLVSRWTSGAPLAWSFVLTHRGSRLGHVLEHLDFHRTPLPAEIDGRAYDVFGRAWGRSPAAWLEQVAERELTTSLTELSGTARHDRTLTQVEFRRAVRAALRDLLRDDALAESPLLGARVVGMGALGARAQALRARLREAAAQLAADPRDEKLHRALVATYLDPAETQELAAERLGVPFSTYRRHLAAAIDRVTEWLWQREQGE